MLKKILLALALLLANFAPTIAGVHMDAFNNNGALLGSNPQLGGPWTITGTSVVNPLTVSGGRLSIAATGQDAFSAFSAQIATTAGTSIYKGFDLNLTSANATGDYFIHFSDPAGTTTNFYDRVFAQSSGAGFVIGVASGSGTGTVTTYGTQVLNFGQNYHVVSAWNFVSGTLNDTFTLFVDPKDANVASNTAYTNAVWSGTLAEPTTNVSAINIRQGTTGPVGSIDNLVVSGIFSEAANISVVPEPSSFELIGMMGLTGLVIASRLRKKKSLVGMIECPRVYLGGSLPPHYVTQLPVTSNPMSAIMS